MTISPAAPRAQRLGSERGQRTAMAPAPAAARASSNHAGPGRWRQAKADRSPGSHKRRHCDGKEGNDGQPAPASSPLLPPRRQSRTTGGPRRAAPGPSGPGERRARHPEMISSTR